MAVASNAIQRVMKFVALCRSHSKPPILAVLILSIAHKRDGNSHQNLETSAR